MRRAAKRHRGSAPAATLVEVAKAARVSPSTVSRILNGTARVAEAKQKAVRAVIARLHFRPNPVAHGLRKGRRMIIGVLGPDVDSPWFGTVFRGVTNALAGSDYVALVSGGPAEREAEAARVRDLIARRVDGVLVVNCRMTDDELRRFSAEIPIAVCGRALRSERMASVSVDNALGGELATRHLLELGHTRVVHLEGPRDHPDAVERSLGYRNALRDAGLKLDPGLLVPAGFQEQEGMAAVERLLESRRPFTAIFAANDQCAAGAHLALHRRGLRVPDDVSIVGFDDIPGARYMTPPLTTVRQPLEEFGRRAVQALLDLLNGRAQPAEDKATVELVVRESTRRLGEAAARAT